MFEGKGGESGKEADGLPTVDVRRIDVEPNMCALERELRLEMEFEMSAPLRGAHWDIKYMVDSVHKRHIIILGRTKTEDYAVGTNVFKFEVDRINVDGIKPSRLANAGLLMATLCGEGGVEVIDVKLVVQASQEEKDGGFTRCIFNPLE